MSRSRWRWLASGAALVAATTMGATQAAVAQAQTRAPAHHAALRRYGHDRTPLDFVAVRLIHSGKVRDLYADGEDLILVASDRVSVYDVILPTPIPDKGKILTQLSLWWFGQLASVVPNHVISATDVPAEWAGRAIRCRRDRRAHV